MSHVKHVWTWSRQRIDSVSVTPQNWKCCESCHIKWPTVSNQVTSQNWNSHKSRNKTETSTNQVTSQNWNKHESGHVTEVKQTWTRSRHTTETNINQITSHNWNSHRVNVTCYYYQCTEGFLCPIHFTPKQLRFLNAVHSDFVLHSNLVTLL